MMSNPPNIVWIFPDEWRHDALGYAGNAVIRTPSLDALAARGIVFRRAYCESPVCQPSRASVLTSRFPRDHGLTQNRRKPRPPDEEARLERLIPLRAFPGPAADNFLHRLQAAGYHTSEVGKMHFHDGEHTPEQLMAYGFDEVDEEYDKVVLMRDDVQTPYTRHLDELGLLPAWREHQRAQMQAVFGRDPHGRRAFPEELDPQHALDAWIGGRTCDAVARRAGRDEPFFLWSTFVGPHVPFDGPPPYADLYDPDTIPLGPLGLDPVTDNAWGEYMRLVIELLGSDGLGEADVRQMAKHYYASISLIDEQIGRIVDAVGRAGLAERTWIVFSSDHGELLGDHGLITKGVFYDASVRVPALIVPPRGGAAVSDELVQGIDVVTTILDLAGADRTGLSGRSLRPGSDEPRRDAVFSQVGAFTMVATDDYKLVAETATCEPQALYDLRSDPDERRDVLADPAYAAVAVELVETRVGPYLRGDVH
jgi:arylsulfatase